MKVQRVEGKRIKPMTSHPWFKENHKVWHNLKAGKIIDIPDKEFESVKVLYGDSISVVKEKTRKIELNKKEVDDAS